MLVQVLSTAEANKELIRVDPLQKLHTLSNLAQLISDGVRGIPRTLRDDSLRAEADAIRQVPLPRHRSLLCTSPGERECTAPCSTLAAFPVKL